MIGIVLVTHGRLAEELVDAMVHIHGPQAAVQTVCIGPDDDMDEQRENILNAVKNADIDDEGVIILTDMFGGTPSNLAISVMDQTNSEVLAGVNLPMLIKLASNRASGADLNTVALEAQEAGRKYISIASALLNQ
ncbi:MAG: PTS sugar transporter subunit IIA [Alphaproteobacteria bacterium]